ncbi:MAG: ROK family protein [Gemmatimonadetes bacterium]|nr:ROK family protein [Gemmatimonadota bacterium]
MPYVIGVDLGGTNFAVGAVSTDGAQQRTFTSELTRRERGADDIVGRIATRVADVIARTIAETGASEADFLGVGIGAPGPLRRIDGVVVLAPNLGWRDYPLRDRVAAAVGLPCTLENDANCATVAEWWIGAAKGAKNVVGVTIGTGIGGGLIIDGALYHGSSDVAGEIGHTTIETAGRRCKCGNYGCLEAYASGPAIAERARESLDANGASSLSALAGGDPMALTAQHVFDAARNGDALAIEVVRDTARYLGAGIANLLNIFNPEVVVLAGGVTGAGAQLLAPLQAEVRRRAFRPAVDVVRIVPGTLGDRAGVVGAAAAFLAETGKGA